MILTSFFLLVFSGKLTALYARIIPNSRTAERALLSDATIPANPFLLAYNLALWTKLRIIYYVNNWIYTTNHKRIAVNYYWFVIFSGICGMVLATIIRLEMAYPGVGILAGDSLQYLSVVTAHAVIMVFFMIMPLLFGAFGNFLLPTQLGVHDVAFPRLNSAAFWFLPAGLLMLVQLVCLDRRYQRMNCYNIREIQTLLKSKYSPNTVENADVRFSLNDTAIGLRYNLGGIDFLDSGILSFYKNAITTDSRYRAAHELLNKPIVEFQSVKLFMEKSSIMFHTLSSFSSTSGLTVTSSLGGFMSLVSSSPFSYSSVTKDLISNGSLNTSFGSNEVLDLPRSALLGSLEYPQTLLSAQFYTMFDMTRSLLSSVYNLIPTFVNVNPVLNTTPLNLSSFTTLPLFMDLSTLTNYLSSAVLRSSSSSSTVSTFSTEGEYTVPTSSIRSSEELSKFSLHESVSDARFARTMNPVFKYDFKVGNYLPDDAKKLNPHLFMTIKDLTTGIRKSSWFTSDHFSTLVQSNAASHMLYFSTYANENSEASRLAAATSEPFVPGAQNTTNVTPSGAFYNVFLLLNSSQNLVNSRWVSVNALDQKFAKMFATGSLQNRIHANWRQLKFTREAWRCKLLASRHQSTLYRRYLNEDSVVWAVERNAKDVLPGWAMITPFSARARFTAIGKVDIGLMGVFLVLNSSIVASANFLVTYRYLSTLNNRKMRDARSFFTEGVMVASWMMIAANPMLAIGILMLLSDRHWQTSFFDYSGGGDTVLFQHMFWFFGHPEVYVIMIPAFGFNNTILSFYLRKRVSARASLLYSMYTIALLGFFVWGHHMYMVGLAHTTRMLFSTLTVMISVPAATKLMHWCVTLVNSSFVIELPMIFQLLFIFFFVSGGISGMAVAHTGMDVLFHDSFYVVGHFHVMLAGSGMFASFGAFYFYFPAIFGVKFSRIYGYLHCTYYLAGQLMTVVPMFWLGYAAMPRRVLDYPAALGGWHAVVSAGHMLSVAGMMAFFVMIFDSLRQSRAATRNSFGVARFNTRLNFYLYEGARTWFIQRKGWYLSRFNRHNSVRRNNLNVLNNEYLETTLYSYVLIK